MHLKYRFLNLRYTAQNIFNTAQLNQTQWIISAVAAVLALLYLYGNWLIVK